MILGRGAAVLLLAGGVTHPCQAQYRDRSIEVSEIERRLELRTDSIVADVGAGGGQFTRELAHRLPRGRVLSTEVRPELVAGLRAIAASIGTDNVTVLQGDQQNTGLPATCCDAILLRLVYHAFDDPRAMRESLAAALRPGGRLMVIDFRPELEQLTEELADVGLEAEWSERAWGGQGGVYAVVLGARSDD